MLFNINNAVKGVAAVADKVYSGITKGPEQPTDEQQLINDITEAHRELKRAESVFNELTGDAAIDYATYNMLAAQARYSYLMNLAKEMNLHF